jgi:hypothetical protein
LLVPVAWIARSRNVILERTVPPGLPAYVPHDGPETRRDSSVTSLDLTSMPTTVEPGTCSTGLASAVFDRMVIGLEITSVPGRL